MQHDQIRIQRALISVSDKTGVVDFARVLAALGVELLSTGGTAKLLASSGLPVIEVGDYTGFPEMMDGRVKTLHPKVHGGILARRDLRDHVEAMREHGIPPIDMVVVNLYPFAQTVAKPGCSMDDAIENIDIGGPAMVRAAAKNHAFVAIVTDPADYAGLAKKLAAAEDRIAELEGGRLSVYKGNYTDYVGQKRLRSEGIATSLTYTAQDIDQLDLQGSANRTKSNRLPDFHSLPNTLRTVGAYLDTKNAELMELHNKQLSVTILSRNQAGYPELEERSLGSLYELFVRQHGKRRNA